MVSEKGLVDMWFWWTILVCDLLIPIVMIIAGWMMWKHTPKRINRWYGYRTALSMKNEQTWKFAHMHAGRIWCVMGIVMLIPTILAFIPFYHSSTNVVGIVGLIVTTVQVIALIASVFPTEAALARTFDENGERKPE